MFKLIVLVGLSVALASAGFDRNPKVNTLSLIPRLPGRIINGTETTIEENPHQISLRFRDLGHYCGGSIISRKWVLTAAHCIGTERPSDYSVIAGTANRYSGGSYHHVVKLIPHEHYRYEYVDIMENDVALVRVREPFKFDAKRKPIALYAMNEETMVGSMAVVTGWGFTGIEKPTILNRVEVPIISKAKCRTLYEYTGQLPEGQICAAYEEGGKDSCQGDSGGPLTVNGRLAGIVSWGEGCGIPKQPGVYTEVAYHRDWIKRHSNV